MKLKWSKTFIQKEYLIFSFWQQRYRPFPAMHIWQGWEFAHRSFAHFAQSNERLWVIRSDHSRQMSDRERIAHSLFFNGLCERIAQVAHRKWVLYANRSGHSPKMSDHEQFTQVAHQKWANRSGCSPKKRDWVNCSFFWANRSFAHFFAKIERFARKTDEQIPSPAFAPQAIWIWD